MKVQKTIAASKFGAGLSEEDTRVLAEISEIRTLRDGEYLAIEGEEDGYLYIIISGILVILKNMPEGGQEILCRLSQYEIAGIAGFIDRQKRLADMRSSGVTEVLAISRSKFKTLIHSHPDVVYKVMCALVRESMDIVKHLDDNLVELTEYFKRMNKGY
jgi:CRP-like cAMP-binding protein